MPKKNHLDLDVPALIDALAEGVAADRRVVGCARPVLVGIHTGGAWIAERIAERLPALGIAEFDSGTLGITFYRDDFSRVGLNPHVSPSKLPESLEGRVVILIDDILYTGRTIRAAMNELFDYGRPDAIVLGILVDRGGRELPIAADVTAARIELPDAEQVKLLGPDPLVLERSRP